MSAPKVIAVMPAYNEAKRIGAVIRLVKMQVDEVVVVDDCSQDDTAAIAKQAGATVIQLPKNGGAGKATRRGCFSAIKRGATIIVTIDSDGQHDATEIAPLVAHLKQNALHIVFGGRPRTKTMPFENRFGNSLLSALSKLLFGIAVKDTLTGFHVIDAAAFPSLCWQSNRYAFVSEIVYRVALNKMTYAELPITTIYHDNKKGMRKRDGLKTILLMLKWKAESLFAKSIL